MLLKPPTWLTSGKRTLDLQEVIEPPARSAGVKLNSVDELIDVLKNTAKVL